MNSMETFCEITDDNTHTTKKYFIEYTVAHVGGGQYEPVSILTEVEVDSVVNEHEGNALDTYECAAEELLDERYEQLAALDDERRTLAAEIRALEEAGTFDQYTSLNDKYQSDEEAE